MILMPHDTAAAISLLPFAIIDDERHYGDLRRF